MLHVLIYNGVVIANNIEFAVSFLKQALGLMFRISIPFSYSMIFVLKETSTVNIHMLFVFFPIDVIFLDEEKKVIDLSRLKPWVGFKTIKNIKYVLEMKAGSIDMFNITAGGQMEFDDVG